MKIIRILLPLFLGTFQVGYSQWVVYNPSNTKGIEGTLVSSGVAASDNKVWFGTDKGIAKFDPEYSVWTNYNTSNGLSSNFIYQVFEDKDGNIWAATNGGGISKYSNSFWTNYTTKDGLSYNVVRAISQSPGGRMWFGTYGHGICSYKPETGFKKDTSRAIVNVYVLSILAVSDDLILIGTLNEGLIILQNNKVLSIQNSNELSGKKVFSIFRDHADKIWLGTDQGAQEFNPVTRSVSPCPDSLQGKAIFSVGENSSHELVFASGSRIYSVSNGTWSSFFPDNLVNAVTFYTAFYDKEGNGWFGSSNQGLFRKSGTSWYNYFNSTGLEDNYYLFDMCEDKNHNIWVSSFYNIYRFDGQNWTNITKKAGLHNDYFGKIITDLDGNIWFASNYKGLYKYDGKIFTNYSQADYFNNGYIACLSLGPDGSIWAGTNGNGVYRFDGTKWTHYTVEQGLANNYVRAMAFFKDGKLLVTSDYCAFSIYDGKAWKADNTLYGSYYIADMAIDPEDNIWFATNNGLIRYKNQQTQAFFADDQYGYNYFTFVSVDNSGQVWAGNYYNGLRMFDGTNWTSYTMSNGLSSNYLKDILFDSRGRIWVIADNGINMSAGFTNIDDPGSTSSVKAIAYPNPFPGSFDIQYSSNTAGFADIIIYSADGRIVKQYNKNKVDAGANTFHFEAENWPNGVLFCKIIMAGSSENIKLLKVSTY
jgi:ligand-binding sensor domain-containing protein